MPREKNTTARIVVPIALLIGAFFIGYITVRSPKQQNTPETTEQVESLPPEDSTALHNDVDASPEPTLTDASQDDPPAIEQAQDTPAQPAGSDVSDDGLHVRFVEPSPSPWDTLGGDGYRLLISFTPVGAGIDSITLTEYFETLRKEKPYSVQERQQVNGIAITSLAARAVTINGQSIDLYASGVDDTWIWTQTAPGSFEATIVNADDEPVARITKQFSLQANSFDIRVDQQLVNLTNQPLDVLWIQYGPVDLPKDEGTYGGDKRRLFFGHLLDPKIDPTLTAVQPSKQMVRQKLVDRPEDLLWPTDRNDDPLVWAALTNRYFTFIVHAPLPEDGTVPVTGEEKRLRLASQVNRRMVLDQFGEAQSVVLELTSEPMRVQGAQTLDLSLGSYAGPLWGKTLGEEETYGALGLNRLVVYNFGGPCAFCTFQPLARLLLWFLSTAHSYLVFDWGLAILLLVVVVRTILHPITKKSQISLQRFTKQMQAVGPKQKELQAKFKDDPQRMKQEMAALFREEGVEFKGALGCLPMFLQSPVWIALFAMLYFAFDLRHQPAFFGVFQSATGGSWAFLANLSEPDAFLPIPFSFSVPLMGEISAINMLPLLLGIVFYLQQKYLTPPPSATMTPEQQTQQKIMKVMMVVMFPVFMYNAPSGLTLYFVTNSTLGILESRYIRAHIDQLDLTAPRKPGDKKKVKNTSPQNPFAKNRDQGSKYKKRK
ncbi:MAG: YidC/Oxa1 family insertase periplasmic-domain containing protein [Planctomycetota bacterium]|jgi:YidC/Oxa1 family membrane protein insertase